jgi:hypothetical protein
MVAAQKWAAEQLRSQPATATSQDAQGTGASSGSAAPAAPECTTAATSQSAQPQLAKEALSAHTHRHARTDTRTHTHIVTHTWHNVTYTKEGSLLPEPTVSFNSATESDGHLYRVLRKLEETQWKLRKAPKVEHLRDMELRALLLPSVAGVRARSNKDQPVCFLHCTTTARDACRIRTATSQSKLYTNWLVRWPRAAISQLIDLTLDKEKELWLKKESTDSEYISECLDTALALQWTSPTVVCLVSPPPDKVEWWDPERLQWTSLSTAISQSAPAAPNPGGTGAGASKVATADAKQALSHHI